MCDARREFPGSHFFRLHQLCPVILIPSSPAQFHFSVDPVMRLPFVSGVVLKRMTAINKTIRLPVIHKT
jgi:hypothetical protein